MDVDRPDPLETRAPLGKLDPLEPSRQPRRRAKNFDPLEPPDKTHGCNCRTPLTRPVSLERELDALFARATRED